MWLFGFQYLLGMVFRLDFLWKKNLFYCAIGAQDERGAKHAHVFSAVHGFLSPRTHELRQLFLRVGNQGEGQIVLFDELLVARGAVGTDTYNFVAGFLELFVIVAQAASLCRAAARVVLGIELQH